MGACLGEQVLTERLTRAVPTSSAAKHPDRVLSSDPPAENKVTNT